MRITVAGASGYIGQKLIKALKENHCIKALSRRQKPEEESLVWEEVDLFSFGSTSDALADTDIAIYLVHSMLPSSRLFQGTFQDTDLMLADNFANACKDHDVKQIIYLSGIVPDGKVSHHLESRKEVEEVFISTGIPCTIFRAGLVVGNGGSSFEILKNLAINLPLMVLPKWTKSKTQVIFIDDMIKIINNSINNPAFLNKTINVTNGENLKYEDLIKQTVRHVGKNIRLIPVPINYTSFSKLWVTVFGEAEYELVSPLVDSLLCDFSNIHPDDLIKDLIEYDSYSNMLSQIEVEKYKSQKNNKQKLREKNNVRSIQRLGIETSSNAHTAAEEYLKWLPSSTNFLIKVSRREHMATFSLFGHFPLLTLEYIHDSKLKDRAKFHVIGGYLTKTNNTGWLEFRSVGKGKFLLASINEFVPSLPWYIYKFSQAPLHKYVMMKFGKYLNDKEINLS